MKYAFSLYVASEGKMVSSEISKWPFKSYALSITVTCSAVVFKYAQFFQSLLLGHVF